MAFVWVVPLSNSVESCIEMHKSKDENWKRTFARGNKRERYQNIILVVIYYCCSLKIGYRLLGHTMDDIS
jgi:hypothetical protein